MDSVTPQDPIDRNRFPVDPWALRELRYDARDLGVTETLFALGNGYLGMRGNVEEGRDAYAHGTFVNGFHEIWPIHHAEEAYGFARVGQTIVNVPDTKTMRLYVDDEPLLLSVADLEQYERTLSLPRRRPAAASSCGARRPASAYISGRAAWSPSPSATWRSWTTRSRCSTRPRPWRSAARCSTARTARTSSTSPARASGTGFDPRRASAPQRPRLPARPRSGQGGGRAVLGYSVTTSGMTLAVAADHSIETTDDLRGPGAGRGRLGQARVPDPGHTRHRPRGSPRS